MASVRFNIKRILIGALLISFLYPKNSYSIRDEEIKSRIIPIIDITAYESFSYSDSGSSLLGFNTTGIFSPTVKLSDRAYIMPLYQGGYQKQYQVVTEDEGNRRYSETQFHNSSLSYYRMLTKRLSSKVTALSRIQFNNETRDEKWTKGLYDYRDMGSACDLNYRFVQGEDMTGEFLGGFEYYMRIYPNYRSLISLISATAPETNEKDYNAYQIVSGYRVAAPRYNGELKYTLLIKGYLDKKVISELGALTADEKRQDYLHITTGGITVPLDKEISLSLSSNFSYNTSSQNYYDTLGTTSNLSDDRFTYAYYDYWSFGISPGFTFKIPVPRSKNVYTLSAGYDFTYRRYTDRLAQESQTTYKSDKQADTLHTIRANLRYPLTKHISMVASGDYTFSRSNMRYNRYYRYNYDILRLSAGLNLKY